MRLQPLLAACAVSLAAVSATPASAQDYPDGPLEFIVPFPPGGASNLIGRAIASAMSEDLGVEITVLNRAGAAGTVGATELSRAEADGYTIGILTSTPLLMRPHTADLPYELSSFELICRGFDNPLILTVATSSGITTLEELMALAENDPAAVRFYSEGPGTLQDIAMNALQEAGGFEALGVPMTGEQTAVQNLLSGVINVAPITAGTALGNPDLLTPIAIMSRERVPNPDVPTVGEVLGSPVIYSLTGAIVAPKGIPADRYGRLVEACATAQGSDSFNEVLGQYSMPPVSETGAGFAEALTGEYDAIGAFLSDM
ncbi:tripartite-type tricarboxylate transporter receptor subunit TctC [Rhodovulum iodosum]|uniref:Tripartite-type tricarboxylate transporter receptor subunit TctC n=1 Tax=Rhodovulum iodosum TaxID=68291 RepID=A0ABV3XV98_9RHOB|nr:tripartite tricarboxylate transporter substrate binding protein [Rhodovulum robiginosum]